MRRTVAGAGRLTLTYTPDDGSPATSHEVAAFPDGGGVAMGMYNYTDSIRLSYSFELHELPPLEIIEFDKGLRAAIESMRVPNFRWGDE